MRNYFIENTLSNINMVLNGEREYKYRDHVLEDAGVVIKELLDEIEQNKTDTLMFKPGDKAYCMIGGKIREVEILIAGYLYDTRQTGPIFCASYRSNIDNFWIKGKWDSQMSHKLYKTREEAENNV